MNLDTWVCIGVLHFSTENLMLHLLSYFLVSKLSLLFKCFYIVFSSSLFLTNSSSLISPSIRKLFGSGFSVGSSYNSFIWDSLIFMSWSFEPLLRCTASTTSLSAIDESFSCISARIERFWTSFFFPSSSAKRKSDFETDPKALSTRMTVINFSPWGYSFGKIE